MKNHIILYLGKIKSQNGRTKLVAIFKNRSQSGIVRSYAAYALGKIGNHSDSQILNDELEYIDSLPIKQKERFAKLKLYIIRAAIRMGNKTKLLPYIIAGVKDDDPNMRISSIDYLGEIKENSVIELLEYVQTYDISPRVKKAAKKALENIQGKKSAIK